MRRDESKETFLGMMGMLTAWVICIFIVVLMSGCAGTMTTETLDAAGNVINRTIAPIADTSVLRDQAFHKTLQNRDQMIVDAHKDSGFKMDWESHQEVTEITMDGKTIVMKSTRMFPNVSYKPEAVFNQPLPTKAAAHPVYGMLERTAYKVVDGFIWWKGIDALGDVMDTALTQAGPDWGSGNTFNQSGNGGDGSYAPITYAPPVAE